MRETFAFLPATFVQVDTIEHELGVRPKTISDGQGRSGVITVFDRL